MHDPPRVRWIRHGCGRSATDAVDPTRVRWIRHGCGGSDTSAVDPTRVRWIRHVRRIRHGYGGSAMGAVDPPWVRDGSSAVPLLCLCQARPSYASGAHGNLSLFFFFTALSRSVLTSRWGTINQSVSQSMILPVKLEQVVVGWVGSSWRLLQAHACVWRVND